jgi:hypothetical protein
MPVRLKMLSFKILVWHSELGAFDIKKWKLYTPYNMLKLMPKLMLRRMEEADLPRC